MKTVTDRGARVGGSQRIRATIGVQTDATVGIAFSRTFENQNLTFRYWAHVLCSNFASFWS